jgi:hypothetical protein
VGRRGRRWALAGLAVLAIGTVIAVVASRSERDDVAVRSDEAFAVVAPGPSRIRRATELQLRFETGTCYPGSDADFARQVNAPLRVEIQDRPEAVVIKARIDHDYVRSISPPARGDACLGIGLGFTRRVRLPSPIGRRALLNGGFIPQGIAPQVIRPSLIRGHNALWSTRIERLRYMGINREGQPLQPGETP